MPPPEEAVVLVMDSGVRHALASSEFGVRVATCTRVAQRLGLEHLADLAPGDLSEAARLFDDTDRRAARHVCTEQGRVQDAVEAMRRRDWAALGRKMLESHCSLRDDYRVSCPELDTIVVAAMAVPGVYGARMTGGGFGGCAIALAEPGATNELCRSVAGEFSRRFDRQPRVFQTVASDGASVVDPMPLP